MKSEGPPTAEGQGDGTLTRCGPVLQPGWGWAGSGCLAPAEPTQAPGFQLPWPESFLFKDLLKLTQRVKGQEGTPQN